MYWDRILPGDVFPGCHALIPVNPCAKSARKSDQTFLTCRTYFSFTLCSEGLWLYVNRFKRGTAAPPWRHDAAGCLVDRVVAGHRSAWGLRTLRDCARVRRYIL